MKKRILIIGNDAGLPGVKIDVENYRRFFKSSVGGNWLDSEIRVLLNPMQVTLMNELTSLRTQLLDYLIIIFSGHGGQERETVLEINRMGEQISESVLRGICHRQLNIFDCCRSYPESIEEATRVTNLIKSFSSYNTRDAYEKRILESISQQVLLYSCSIGEVSHDTSEGGAYSKNLIFSAADFTSGFKLVGDAHAEAARLTTREFNNQHPEAILPRCLSSQQLIIGIK